MYVFLKVNSFQFLLYCLRVPKSFIIHTDTLVYTLLSVKEGCIREFTIVGCLV